MKFKNKRVIFDFGANNGTDIGYYLKKGDIVVVVEANILLCEAIKQKYKKLLNIRVFVENCFVVDVKNSKKKLFYFHKHHPELSTGIKPEKYDFVNFTGKEIKVETVDNIIFKYTSNPFFIKIDLESYDYFILKKLFKKKIYSDFLSVEFHDIRIIALFLNTDVYKSFNYVEGGMVPFKYKNYLIHTKNGQVSFSFQNHSSGPFGDDLKSFWLHPDNFFRLIMFIGPGWRDIHASKKIKVGKKRNREITFIMLWFFVIRLFQYIELKIRLFLSKEGK